MYNVRVNYANSLKDVLTHLMSMILEQKKETEVPLISVMVTSDCRLQGNHTDGRAFQEWTSGHRSQDHLSNCLEFFFLRLNAIKVNCTAQEEKD